MKHRLLIVGLLLGALVFTTACGMVSSLLGGRSSGTVNELWSDVPRMDGMTKAEMDMPLAARLMVQTVSQGKMNFIAYTIPSGPQAVLDYYTTARMADAGWDSPDATGCYGDASTAAEAGAMCIFGKQGDGTKEILAVVAATNDATQGTAIFFVRIDATEETSQ